LVPAFLAFHTRLFADFDTLLFVEPGQDLMVSFTAPASPLPVPHAAPATVRIEAPRGWLDLRLSQVWEYRELLYFFVWRDVKVRYKQTVMGVAWVVLPPLLTIGLFTLFFGRLAKLPGHKGAFGPSRESVFKQSTERSDCQELEKEHLFEFPRPAHTMVERHEKTGAGWPNRAQKKYEARYRS
jgi:hypothetical protein